MGIAGYTGGSLAPEPPALLRRLPGGSAGARILSACMAALVVAYIAGLLRRT
jgi:hypothetical protein